MSNTDDPSASTAGHTLSPFRQPGLSAKTIGQRSESDYRRIAAARRQAAAEERVKFQENLGLDDDSEMWKTFLDEVKEEDSRFTDAWKEDANSIVTFTGIFSAIVGAFIIEFYKKLSPDTGDQTVALLQQISHQISNSSKKINFDTTYQPSSPGTTMVWVNTLWLISLVLSLTCALIATLLQQWARKYIETPKLPYVLRHRARVRSLLLTGTKSYQIPVIVEMLPTLLHLSVYLFLAGLAITFHTIHKKVAIAVDLAVGVSGLAYLALSLLPCLDVRCPYRTPISKILWYPYHALLSFTAPFLRRCIQGFRALIDQPAQSRLSVSNHWQHFTYGLEKSIVYHAVETLKDGDRGRVTWLFNRLALGNRHTFLKFAASIPIHKIPDLIPSIESVSLRDSLLVLLRSAAGTRPGLAARLDLDVHRRSLLVCLHTIYHIAKVMAPTTPDLDIMRDNFADTDLMGTLWNDDDDSIRIASRSICALFARQVVRKPRLDEEDLHWLQEVIGSPSNAILEADVTVRDQMNFKSFVRGVLSNHVSHLSIKDTIFFKETLAILLGESTDGHDDDFTIPYWQIRLSEEIERIKRYDHQGGLEVFNKLRLVFPVLPPALPPAPAPPTDAAIPPSRLAPDPSNVIYPPREVLRPRAPPFLSEPRKYPLVPVDEEY